MMCLFIIETMGQDTISTPKKIYKYNYKVEIPVTAGLFALNFYGFHLLSTKPKLDTIQINALDQNDVWSFDRRVFSQSHPAPDNVYTISDIGLWVSYCLPALLFIDPEIRKSWLDITLIYLETQAINLNVENLDAYFWRADLSRFQAAQTAGAESLQAFKQASPITGKF